VFFTILKIYFMIERSTTVTNLHRLLSFLQEHLITDSFEQYEWLNRQELS
jgi:hypothetical protein